MAEDRGKLLKARWEKLKIDYVQPNWYDCDNNVDDVNVTDGGADSCVDGGADDNILKVQLPV